MRRSDEPQGPFFILDDDDWLDVHASVDELKRSLEAPFLDDVVAAFDGLARFLHLSSRNDMVEVEFAAPGENMGLPEAVDRFFRAWTKDAAPEHREGIDEYVQAVLLAYRNRREARKKNR